MKSKRNPFHMLATTTLVMAFSAVFSPTFAAVQTWDGAASGVWDTTALNWGGVAFTSSNDALFTGTPTNDVTSASGLTIGSITLDSSFTGKVTFTGANTVSGTTTLNGGTLQMGAGGTAGSIGGAIVNNAALAFNYGTGANVTIGNSISGTGSVTLTAASGTPRVHFNGTNTYSGTTTIGAGVTLEVNAAAAVSANSDYTVNGDIESYNGIASLTIGALNGSGNIYNTGSSGGTTTFAVGANGHSGNFGGVIRNGAWGSRITALTKTGTGTQTLSGANTYTGATKIAAGTLEVTTNGVIANNVGGFEVGNTANTNAVLAVTGGTVTDSNTTGNAWASTMSVGFGSLGSGFVNLSSGTLNARRQLFIGNSNAATEGAYGAMTVSDGALNVGSYFGVGFSKNTYGVFNQTGGTVTQNQTSGAGAVLLGSGWDGGAFGVMNLSGGSLTANGGIYVSENGAGTGILNISGSADVTAGAVGIKFGNSDSASTGIVNLLGGTLTTNIVQRGNLNGTATFNFNGGTLKASAASATFMTGLSNAYVHSGGGTIDNNGNAITIGQALLAPTGNGVSASGLAITGGSGYIDTPVVVISGGGGTGATAVATVSGGEVTGITITNPGVDYTSVPSFTLVGGGGSGASIGAGTATVVANTSGNLTFSGTGDTTLTGMSPDFTGSIAVPEGTLNVTGDISSSALTLGAATLRGNGYLGGVTVNDAAAEIVAGNGDTDILSLTSLTFETGATLNLNKKSDSFSSVLDVSGNLTTPGTKNHDITLNLPDGLSWVSGETYDLITFGSFSGSVDDFIVVEPVPGLGGRQTATLIDTGFSIALEIGGTTPYWTGAVNNRWTTTGNVLNWKRLTDDATTYFEDGDVVLFDDNANPARTTVDIFDGDVLVAAVRFNNTVLDYTITSSNGFGIVDSSLPATFTKDGSGKVTIDTINDYFGATTINDGTLELRAGDIEGTSGVTNDGTLVFNRESDIFTLSAPISGFGDVIKDGAGTQILTGANTYSGDTTINAGTLQVGDGGSTGALGTGLVTNNGSLVFDLTGNVTVPGAIDGIGSLTQVGMGVVTLSSANTYSGGTTVTSGTLVAANAGGLGTNTITLDGGHLRSGASIPNNIVVNGVAGLTASANLDVSGTITGSGTLDNGVITTNYSMSIIGDISGFTGTIAHTASHTHNNLNLGGGTAASMDASQAKMVLSGDTPNPARRVNINGVATPAYKLGDLSGIGGAININNGTTLEVGALNLDSTFAGLIGSNGALHKVGTGTLTLTGANTYTGDTTVSAGVLAVDGDAIANTGKLVINGGKVDPMGATEVVNTLYFGSTQKAAGTWGAPGSGAANIDDVHFTGTGVISVTTGPAGNTYADWATANAPGQTMDQDHDGDGVDNGIEYFMGLSDSGFTANPAPANGTVIWPMGADYPGVYGTDYEIQTSTDLVDWVKVNEGPGDNTVTVNLGPTPPRSVVYDMPTGGKRFVRLVVKN